MNTHGKQWALTVRRIHTSPGSNKRVIVRLGTSASCFSFELSPAQAKDLSNKLTTLLGYVRITSADELILEPIPETVPEGDIGKRPVPTKPRKN